jgi:peptide/nickel transport system permease protein
MIGLVIVLFVAFLAMFGPFISPHDPNEQAIAQRLLPPFWDDGGSMNRILGTDQLGRDELSRLIYAARWSLLVGVLAAAVALVIGVPLGLAAGFYGRYVDAVVSFFVNVVIAFPFIVLALGIIAFLGPSFFNMVLTLGIAGWVTYARVVRSEVLSLRERDYVVASQSIGAPDRHVLFRHLRPGVADSGLVLASLQVASMILAEAFLSFIGFGIQPPTASWGSMVSDARVYMLTRWWLATFPGALIFLTALGVNMLGDGLRDYLDPRSRKG